MSSERGHCEVEAAAYGARWLDAASIASGGAPTTAPRAAITTATALPSMDPRNSQRTAETMPPKTAPIG